MMLFDIYHKGDLIKSACTMQAFIPACHALSDEEVRQYFGIDEYHKDWERAHRPNTKYNRLVFDKVIIPDCIDYSVTEHWEDNDEV